MLGHIIHDWDDSKAGLILDNLRRAMASGARLIVFEYVIPEVDAGSSGDGASLGNWLDLHMMVATGASSGPRRSFGSSSRPTASGRPASSPPRAASP
jgi:hypothetical protein